MISAPGSRACGISTRRARRTCAAGCSCPSQSRPAFTRHPAAPPAARPVGDGHLRRALLSAHRGSAAGGDETPVGNGEGGRYGRGRSPAPPHRHSGPAAVDRPGGSPGCRPQREPASWSSVLILPDLDAWAPSLPTRSARSPPSSGRATWRRLRLVRGSSAARSPLATGLSPLLRPQLPAPAGSHHVGVGAGVSNSRRAGARDSGGAAASRHRCGSAGCGYPRGVRHRCR